MKCRGLGWLLLTMTAACSSTLGTAATDAGPSDAAPDPVDVAVDVPVDAGARPAVNPYGVPYPTDHIGTRVKALQTPGSRIQNFSFASTPKGSTISFADFFDPERRTYDVVVVVGGGMWDPHTAKTLDALVGSTKRIARVNVLGQGNDSDKAATSTELATWAHNIRA